MTKPKKPPTLSDEQKSFLRSTTADQMAEFEARNAAASYATRNLKTERAPIGAKLEAPIVIVLESTLCLACGNQKSGKCAACGN